jgi:Flp pilus assembly protein CpaB
LRRTSRLVLLAGVFLAALTFVVFIFLSGPPSQPSATPTPPPAELPTVVARVDIPLGTEITAEMVTTRTMSVDNRESTALGDVSQAIGYIAGTDIATGSQVTSSDFLVRDVQLTVPAGRRAFAISVDELTGVGNLVETGDTVDVLISFSGGAFPVVQVLADGSITIVPGVNPLSVKVPVLLQDVQVIGTIDPPPQAPQTDANGNPLPSQAPVFAELRSKLLILAVTPAQAEVLLFARTSGTLDVILRSPDDVGITEETTGVILKTLVDQYGVLPPELIEVTIPTPKP